MIRAFAANGNKAKKHGIHPYAVFALVRMSGLEPPTPCMSSRYSNQLSYTLKCSYYYIISHTKKSSIIFSFVFVHMDG